MKLIFRYCGGSYEDSFDDMIPIEYESKEKLRQDLIAAVNATVERWSKRNTWTTEEWNVAAAEARKKAFAEHGTDGEKYVEKYNKLIEEMGFVYDYGDFVFCGKHFNAGPFCTGSPDELCEGCETIRADENYLEILTIDEWFESKGLK